MTGPHAAEVIGDIRNFTNAQPVIQINERVTPAAKLTEVRVAVEG
jgi:hypothetical protein